MFRKILVCAIIVTVACGGETLTAPLPVPGTYDLSRVNGNRLPTAFPDSETGVPITVLNGTLVLDANGMVVAQLALVAVVNGDSVRPNGRLTGTYTVGHDTVYVREGGDGAVFPALLHDGRLDVTYESISYTFIRRSDQ